MMLRGIAIIATVGMFACKPTISYLRGEPNVICLGRSAQISWSASASGALVETSSALAVTKTSPAGSTHVSPSRSTTYRLNVTSVGGTTSREIDVDVIASVTPREIGASIAQPGAKCVSATLTVVAVPDAAHWDSRVLAGSVVALGNRPLHIEHAGIRVDLPANGETTVFKDVAVIGPWTLSTPLQAGEQCGVQVPPTLAVRVTPTCSS
jgi:hypothetical protein